MNIIQAESYEDALHEVRRRQASSGNSNLAYKIVKSRYGDGFDIVVVDRAMLADMLVGNLPLIPALKNTRPVYEQKPIKAAT